MRQKRILLLGGNYYPEPTGIGKYNTEMMDWLAQHNYECAVITTYPYYPYWKIQAPYTNKAHWYKKETRTLNSQAAVTVYRCPHYVPAAPSGMKRVVSDMSFFMSAFLQLTGLLFRRKYDYVLVVAPPFQVGLLGWMYKKIKGARLVYHIQDLQIDAAVELNMIKSKWLARLMFRIEKFILRKADFVSSISEGMINKIRAKYERPVIMFPNWADTSAFFPIKNKAGLKQQFGFAATDKIVLYSGAIGEKQGLQGLLQTALEMQHDPNVKFVICGSGPYKARLVEMAGKLGVCNIVFMSLQPAEKFNAFLNIADVHMVMQKANENELFMPSKLMTICAVGGLVVVTASKNTSLYNVVSGYNMGIVIAPEDQLALTNAVQQAVYADHSLLKSNARKFADEHLSIDAVIGNYFSSIDPQTSTAVVPMQKKREQVSDNHSYLSAQVQPGKTIK